MAKLTFDVWSWADGLQLLVHRENSWVGLVWVRGNEGRRSAVSERSLSGVAQPCWVFAKALQISHSHKLLNPDWLYHQLTSMIRSSPDLEGSDLDSIAFNLNQYSFLIPSNAHLQRVPAFPCLASIGSLPFVCPRQVIHFQPAPRHHCPQPPITFARQISRIPPSRYVSAFAACQWMSWMQWTP